jgi:hypothetical protein
MGYNVKSSTDATETSLEDSFTNVYWRALGNLQSCWMGDSGFDPRKFNQQLLFLIRLLPDKAKQDTILKIWADAAKETAAMAELDGIGLDKSEVTAYAGMEVVTETVIFIVQAFELIHSDIIAPATSKEYQRAVLEIPDMDERVIDLGPKEGDTE